MGDIIDVQPLTQQPIYAKDQSRKVPRTLMKINWVKVRKLPKPNKKRSSDKTTFVMVQFSFSGCYMANYFGPNCRGPNYLLLIEGSSLSRVNLFQNICFWKEIRNNIYTSTAICILQFFGQILKSLEKLPKRLGPI